LAPKNIQIQEWSGKSLELNPIENLWNLVKTKLSEKYLSVFAALQTSANVFSAKEIYPDCLYNGITHAVLLKQKKLVQALKNKGGYTKDCL